MVRCIICNRIKQPLGAPPTVDLEGMRCDMSCPGYTLDPPPINDGPAFVRYQPPRTNARPTGDQVVDVIGRALCKVHFGV
jgi:hypothetical protein